MFVSSPGHSVAHGRSGPRPVPAPADPAECARAAKLVDARTKAAALFSEIQAHNLVAAGHGEREVSDMIRDLANEMFGTTHYWHKRIVRSGPNTLLPYRDNPPDREIGADDIAFADFGPIFEDFEADFGRTFVLGRDSVKHRLRNDLTTVFEQARGTFQQDPDITGRQLYANVARLADEAGWALGGWHAGHLVGEFPPEHSTWGDPDSHIVPANDKPLRRTDGAGRLLHWILEIHLVDRERGFGGFHEDLLDL